MIEEKFIDLFAYNSKLQDKLVAEREVVLTYALEALFSTDVLTQLAFKGGTCLRKMFFGSTGRLSEDLDFTLYGESPEEGLILDVINVFNQERWGITFSCNQYYETADGRSYGGEVTYSHSWNELSVFNIQVSVRESPTLTVSHRDMLQQPYFKYLEFTPPKIPMLEPIEMTAEKIRAAYQRVKVRDLYDLYSIATTPFDCEILRMLVVLKLWQVRDPFNPPAFFQNILSADYDWDDLRRLIGTNIKIQPEKIINSIKSRYSALADLSDLEIEVIQDSSSGWNFKLANKLRRKIRDRFCAP